MAKSNFEPYAYLYDNGFFDPIEVIVDDNEIRVPETIVPENIYYTPSKSTSKNSKPDKYENFLKRLYEIWRYGCDGLEFVQKIWLPTLLICLMAGAADAKYLKSNPKYLIILIIIFSIISLITIIYAIWDMNGGKMLKSLLLKNQGLCKNQTLYTLNFNYDVIPVKLYDIYLEGKNDILFTCTTLIGLEDNCLQKYITLNNDELFLTPEQALEQLPVIQKRQISTLADILQDKSAAFLNGKAFRKYAALYYKKQNVSSSIFDTRHDHIAIYDFLTTKDSLIKFCKFIKEAKFEKAVAEQKKNAQAEKERAILNDALSSLNVRGGV
ncbi:Uncharacterised protein [uncultured Ruminococcus sp.]|uniref:hypothetical protein n=1 Tax=Huintestinicola butyrica TaxID=2981728 RepID=UPI00082141ED|nr:hypothetical protein [Huintestinicola butyrica]MCU6727697.1 hypothetical protein [Huintestinicola butyrica]SCI90815.1 Uncharacterised protein [uncultured Ruminococcus sp.]